MGEDIDGEVLVVSIEGFNEGLKAGVPPTWIGCLPPIILLFSTFNFHFQYKINNIKKKEDEGKNIKWKEGRKRRTGAAARLEPTT